MKVHELIERLQWANASTAKVFVERGDERERLGEIQTVKLRFSKSKERELEVIILISE